MIATGTQEDFRGVARLMLADLQPGWHCRAAGSRASWVLARDSHDDDRRVSLDKCRNLARDKRGGMPTKVEITDHWTDTGRKLFLAEVKVATDHFRNFPPLMIEVPDQGNVEANIQEARRSLQRFAREIEKALQSPLRLARDRAPR